MTVKTETNEPGGFDALISEMDEFSKAMKCADGGDKKIVKAAEDGADEGDEGDSAGDVEADEADGEMMGKSFTVTMPDGTEVEAFDGAAMMKALSAQNVALVKTVETQGAELSKSLKAAELILGVVKEQGDLIKSLRADVERLGRAGAGRKAVLSVLEKPAVGGDKAKEGMTGDEFLAKAAALNASGKLSGQAVARIEAYRNNHTAFPADLVEAVARASAV